MQEEKARKKEEGKPVEDDGRKTQDPQRKVPQGDAHIDEI